MDHKVGRIETTMALLRHFERLATPHIPRDTIVGVDRSVHQAVRVGKQLQKRMLHEETLALMNPRQHEELPTAPRADCEELEVRALDAECFDPPNAAPMCSGGEPWGVEGAVSILSRTPSPIVPFCIDISLQSFRSFLDLIKGIRQEMSVAVSTAPAQNPVGVDKADSSTAQNEKRPMCKAQVTTKAIGPESCEEPNAGIPKKVETFGKRSKQHQAAPAPHDLDGFAIAPRLVQMEVLRGTLRLLKVNLFHLVRVAATRRACRGNGVIELSSEMGGDPVFTEGHDGSRREATRADEETFKGGVEGGSDKLQSRGSRTGAGINDAERGNKKAPPATHRVEMENLGQKGYSGCGECDEDMHGVIRELHVELRAILEDVTNVDTEPETTDAALALQVRSVFCCCGFFKIYSSACAI